MLFLFDATSTNQKPKIKNLKEDVEMKKFDKEMKGLGFEKFGEKIWELNESELNVEVCCKEENLIIVRIESYDLFGEEEREVSYEICKDKEECIDLLRKFLLREF